MKKIEVYVRSEAVFSTDVYREKGCEYTAAGQVDMFRPQSKLQFKQTKALAEADQEALRTISEIAERKGLRVSIYGLSTVRGSVKARLKGVDETPTVFVDDQEMEGLLKIERLLQHKH